MSKQEIWEHYTAVVSPGLKECFATFSVEVGQWKKFPFLPRLKREGALMVYFHCDTNWGEVVCERVERTVCVTREWSKEKDNSSRTL